MYVNPKTDCPHVDNAKLINLFTFEQKNCKLKISFFVK